MGNYRRFTGSERAEIWDRYAAGESKNTIAATFGRYPSAIQAVMTAGGGVRPYVRHRSARALGAGEREEISRGLAAGESLRSIGTRLLRSPSTISREVRRNGGPLRYRAGKADNMALRRARRPKAFKITRCERLQAVIEDRLEHKWSPRQISKWLPGEYPDDPEMRVSHETIYMSLYVQGRGALRKELHQALRSGRAVRHPKRQLPNRKGQIHDMVLISERPPEVEDRAVPGHWEGDLIMGTGKSCIGTLVERSTRYVMLLKLEKNTAEAVRIAMSEKILELPAELRRTITWDRGKEMAEHRAFTIATGVQIYFCDPKSPWQRGSNENTNGLLRQYFPKRTNLAQHSKEHLDFVARELNERPRQTLGWMTPSEKLAEVVASTG